MFRKIFEPGKIGNIEIKNRLVVPPMLTEFADEDGRLTERYIRYYEEKAKGGWGLIICEDNAIDPKGFGFKCVPGVWSDDLMPEHKELVKRVHVAGAKIAVQLYHAGRQSHSSLTGELPVAPSAIQDPLIGQTPRELSTSEVEALVERFALAAKRCKDVGYDAVEIHGAHGYLVNQFLSPFSNKRTDKYGGTFNNRLRFPLEIIQIIRNKVGVDYPIIYRISAQEHVEGGLTIEDTKAIAIALENAGVSAIHASGGVYKSSALLCAPTPVETAVFSDYAKAIKSVVDIPVLTVNKIVEPEVAESLLREGKADFISMGRASLADPQLPNKVRDGRMDEILHCIGCRQGCWNKLLLNEPISCLVNPLTGKEDEYEIHKSSDRKKVMVVGGGPSGMQAAIVAAKRGHQVTLYEKEDRLGGQWLLAAIPPGKELLNSLTVWQKGELEREGVKVVLNTAVDRVLVASGKPDHVIAATGSLPIIPKIKGADLPHVYKSKDILSGKIDFTSPAVVIGGGMVGVETADHLAVHNQSVSIIELLPEIGKDMESGSRHFLLKSLKNNDVKLYLQSRVLEIKENEVVIESNNGIISIPASIVILAVGSMPSNQLENELEGQYKIDVIGDSYSVGNALEAINHAYKTALKI